jgi:hypothetical protein
MIDDDNSIAWDTLHRLPGLDPQLDIFLNRGQRFVLLDLAYHSNLSPRGMVDWLLAGVLPDEVFPERLTREAALVAHVKLTERLLAIWERHYKERHANL